MLTTTLCVYLPTQVLYIEISANQKYAKILQGCPQVGVGVRGSTPPFKNANLFVTNYILSFNQYVHTITLLTQSEIEKHNFKNYLI